MQSVYNASDREDSCACERKGKAPTASYTPPEISLTHTSFNRTSQIIQDNQKVTFSYGPDKQRNISRTYNNNNVLQTTRYYNGSYEKEVTGSAVKEYDYIYSPAGLAAIVIKTGSTTTKYYTHTDHLGSLRVLTDAGKNVLSRYHYDAWGKRTLVAGSNITNRGFTMHEHLNDFGLINMNARLYDPVLGRFLSPDPAVPDMSNSQDYNRYSYVRNNPLIYTDPDGEFWWLIAAAAAYTLFFTDSGYDVQKYISPVAVKFEVHPFGTHERFFGVKTSVGVPQIFPVSYRWEWGANYCTRFYDTGWKGWETTYGEEFGLFGLYTAGYTNYKTHGFPDGDFNQTLVSLKIGVPGLSVRYTNDYINPSDNMLNFARKITPDRIITKGDDKHDRWRTAAFHVQVGPVSRGMKVITGDPGPWDDRYVLEDENGQKYYAPHGKYDPLKYSNGILYWGIGPLRFGTDSEQNRHKWQNVKAHDRFDIPHFPMVPGRYKRRYWFW